MVIALYYKYNMKYACNSFIKVLRDKKTYLNNYRTKCLSYWGKFISGGAGNRT